MIDLIRGCCKPVLRQARDAMLCCGVGPKLKTQDRAVLEHAVFPGLLADPSIRRVLFVGCHWYTWHYNKIFADRDYWTLEIDPARKRYGSKQHLVDSVENVAQHFETGSLDAVMLLGVIGWGLDDPAVAERSVAAIHGCLRTDGVFINGWDDAPEHRPFDIEALPALRAFRPWVFPPLDSARFVCDQQTPAHILNFYRADP